MGNDAGTTIAEQRQHLPVDLRRVGPPLLRDGSPEVLSFGQRQSRGRVFGPAPFYVSEIARLEGDARRARRRAGPGGDLADLVAMGGFGCAILGLPRAAAVAFRPSNCATAGSAPCCLKFSRKARARKTRPPPQGSSAAPSRKVLLSQRPDPVRKARRQLRNSAAGASHAIAAIWRSVCPKYCSSLKPRHRLGPRGAWRGTVRAPTAARRSPSWRSRPGSLPEARTSRSRATPAGGQHRRAETCSTMVEGLMIAARSPSNGRASNASASSSNRPTSAGAAPRLRHPTTSLRIIGSLNVVARPGWSKQLANSVEQQKPE